MKYNVTKNHITSVIYCYLLYYLKCKHNSTNQQPPILTLIKLDPVTTSKKLCNVAHIVLLNLVVKKPLHRSVYAPLHNGRGAWHVACPSWPLYRMELHQGTVYRLREQGGEHRAVKCFSYAVYYVYIGDFIFWC